MFTNTANTMKTIAFAAGIVLIGASAAMAAPKQRNGAHANPRGAFAYAHPYDAFAATQAADHNSVYVGGHYRGADPDPNIRAALRRDNGRSGD